MAKRQLEAVRLSRNGDNLPVIISWVNSCGYHAVNKGRGRLEIYGADNAISPNAAGPGDWIIRDTEGRLFPCKSDAFDETYEAERRKAFSTCTHYNSNNERGDAKQIYVTRSRDSGCNTA